MASGEFDLIRQAFVQGSPRPHPGTVVINGDDASVHKIADGTQLVVSCDLSIAGVHWPETLPLKMAADRAVCSALSDLAAMGAEACWAWVSVMAGSKGDLFEIGEGINAAVARYRVELAGGDTARSPVTTALNITVAGTLPEGAAMCRDRAEQGDNIWIIGRAGFASLGLKQWTGEMQGDCFKHYFAMVTPKLKQGVRLQQLGIRCSIDVSDGVLSDAGHIARASNIAMVLELSAFPGWHTLCDEVGEQAAAAAVTSGGEDYALIFTAAKEMNFPYDFATCIGHCHAGEGVEIVLHNKKLDGLSSGYDHFI